MLMTGVDPSVIVRALHGVAVAFEYPDGPLQEAAMAAPEAAEPIDPDMAGALRDLLRFRGETSEEEAQEIYSRLFDLQPVCTLHLGYHLFGEAYQRGALLSGLAVEMRKAGVATRGELPDYLPAVLELLAALPDGEDREMLVDGLLLPALTRMTEAMKESESPWARVLRSLPGFLAPLGGGCPLPPPERTNDIDLEVRADA